MRVIGGREHGRRLHAGKGQGIRPTAAKVRGAIFNIVVHRWRLDDAAVLDLFAGAGALGIEALSRGAQRVTFVESHPHAVRILRRNLEQCGLGERVAVMAISVAAALRRLHAAGQRFDGVFLDPPYASGLVGETMAALGAAHLVRSGGWVIAEHGAGEAVAERFGNLRLTQSRRYGKTALSIFEADAEAEGA